MHENFIGNVHNEKTYVSTIIISRRADADKVVHISKVLTTSCKDLITMKLGVNGTLMLQC